MENIVNLQKQKQNMRNLYKKARRSFLEANKTILSDEYYVSKYFPSIENLIQRYSDQLIRRNHGNELTSSLVVAGYWPLTDETNVVPLLTKLHEKSFKICLPVIENMR